MASLVPKQEKLLTTAAWAAQTWKVALLINTFVYDHATHSTYTSVAGSEVVGTGYTIGGATLAGKTSSYVDSTTVKLEATNLAWGPGASFSNVGFVVCYDTSGSKLIRAIFQLTVVTSVTDGTFTLIWHASGLIRIA